MEKTTAKQPKKRAALPKLTKKQRVFVDNYVATENGQDSALKAYEIESRDKENVARAIASENLTKPNIIEAIEVKRKSLKQALIDKGITEDYLAGKVQTLLSAVDKEGNVDYGALDKGLKHATSIYGVEDPDEKPRQTNTYNFIFSPEVQGDVKEIEARIKARLTKRYEPIQES